MVGALVGLGLAGRSVWAQGGYPQRPVRLLLGLPAGTAPDVILRVIGQGMGRELRQSVFVDNKPGASSIIAMQELKRSAADGYTIAAVDPGAMIINRYAFKQLPYNPIEDFIPIGLIHKASFFLIASQSTGLKTARELIAYAKANPGKLQFGSLGVAHTTRLAMEQFMAEAGIELRHIPYKEASQMVTAVGSGEIGVILNSPLTAKAVLDTGRARLLAVCASQRVSSFPEVPTLREATGLAMPDMGSWIGLVAPAGTPSSVADRLHDVLNRTLADRSVQERHDAFAMTASPSARRIDFADFIAAEDRRYAELIQSQRIQFD